MKREVASGEAAGYRLRLAVTLPGRGLRDTWNVLGLLPDGAPPVTLTDAPGIGEHLRLSLVDASDGRPLAASLHPHAGQGRHWTVEVVWAAEHDVFRRREQVALGLTPEGTLPEGFDVHVLAAGSGEPLPAGPAGVGLLLEPNRPVRLVVVVGTAAYAAAVQDETTLAARFTLEAGYPNPFREHIGFRYQLGAPCSVSVTVYDALGREVRRLETLERAAGTYELVWDGRDAAGRHAGSGVYFVRMQAGDFIATRTVLRVR